MRILLMSLNQELAKFRAEFRTQLPAEILTRMDQATEDLTASGIMKRTVKVGDQVPDFTLPNALGNPVHLQNLLAKGPVVIAFYRGVWCPYCNLELNALQKVLPDITALDASLVAISPQTPDYSLSTTEKHALGFEVLSDVGNQVARTFGLVFDLPEELRPIYAKFGIDLPAHNGDQTFELPIPATYVIDAKGRINHAFVDPDYTRRMEPDAILSVLNSLQVTV
jgi:peroxiredoxin